MRSRIDLEEKVENKDRRFGSATEYYPATVIIGRLHRPALFTPRQIGEALERAKSNPEDVPKPEPGLLGRIKSWLAARWVH